MTHLSIKPELISWACTRAGFEVQDLVKRFPHLTKWILGQKQPTFTQLEQFAKVTHTPFGYFFLSEPPEERLPISDFRTLTHRPPRPSPELLDTIYAMQKRQNFLREICIEDGAAPLSFVGSARSGDDPLAIGMEMRRLIGLDDHWTESVPTWREAVGELRRRIEQIGVMAIINGVVGNNTHRKLDVNEFRGFALPDCYAPLIFVNGADAKSAQMFTLAHELAHLWFGSEGEGLSGFDGIFPDGGGVEAVCDKAAAEFLVPARILRQQWVRLNDGDPFEKAARFFKVSPIVAARRAMELDLVDRQTFFEFYQTYSKAERHLRQSKGGGDFYHNQNTRLGEYFARSVVFAALEGRVTFKEAYDLTGLRGGAFQDYARRVGVPLP